MNMFRQERFAFLFGEENTSKVIPSPTQVNYYYYVDILTRKISSIVEKTKLKKKSK